MASTAKGSQISTFGKIFRVLEKNCVPHPYSIILEHRQQESALLFESNAIAVLSSQELESVKRQYTKIQDAYGSLGILQFNSGDTTVLFLVTITACVSVGKIYEHEIFRITQTSFISLRNHPQDDELVSDIKKLLNSGTFYFSRSPTGNNTFDLTLCAQRQRKGAPTDNRFFWNRMLHIYFIRFEIDTSLWLYKMMCGSVEIRTVYIRHKQARAVIISRLSCERAGTRFNVRGCNDDGHVANFVETEQVIYLDNKVTSYIQTRGSVPLFWEQPGVQVGSHKVKLSRSVEASGSAYDKHFLMLKRRYNDQVIINLLSSSLTGSREGEASLSQMFQNHHNNSDHRDIPHVVYDYHSEIRGANKSLNKLRDQIDCYIAKFGLFYAIGDDIVSEQRGTFRTNCLDCLDRTNCVQTFIGLEILTNQLKLLCDEDNTQQFQSRFEEVYKQMWINNGNEISKIYAGTGAIQGGSKLMDGARSAARTIQNNLLDNSKQEAIDVFLLGNTLNSDLSERARMLLSTDTLHASTTILREMCKRFNEYTYTDKIRVAVGTYNVNGGKHFRSVVYKDVSLSDWLLDTVQIAKTKSLIDATTTDDDEIPVDIFAIGFEEIVDLNASNIMAASSENATLWAEELQKVLSRDYPYVLLTYVQLVGVCLYVFLKSDLIPHIKDVATDSVKTGLGGATGNKGGVAIRFVLHSTSLCFVCSHFAAGQSQVHERNADYAEITKKIAFPMSRTLQSHDYVFWCGDFNYRVDMDKEVMKDLIRNNMLDDVLENDQLLQQKKENKVFEEYLEGEITFPPTYKYDLFSDDYDTSEKCRAPAWTDRVLWRKRKMYPEEDQTDDWNPGKLIHYGRAELKQSDHRPVIAILQVDIRKVDSQRRDQVFENVLQSVGPLDGTIVLRMRDSSLDISSVFDDSFMAELLQKLSVFGDVILVRFVENVMWVTFNNGRSAVEALHSGGLEINSHQLEITLKSPNWIQQTMNEINICNDNTISLYESADLNIDPKSLQRPDKRPDNKPPPSRPPAPIIRPKAGVFSIPANLHQPLQPTVVDTTAEKLADKCNIAGDQPPPIPQRNYPSSSAKSQKEPSEAPPPVPARMGAPPIPPR
ncbi:synaptojanin-1 [Planococcus citri]|uniref:synaptojanin-1 n=1 Tax=Planococcus citri TaxID=170843 RepID=UPI0031F90BA2